MEASIQKLFKGFETIKYLPIRDMDLNKTYQIIKIERVESKYGETVRCILNDGLYIYLPRKFHAISQDQMMYLNEELHILQRISNIDGSFSLNIQKDITLPNFYAQYLSSQDF